MSDQNATSFEVMLGQIMNLSIKLAAAHQRIAVLEGVLRKMAESRPEQWHNIGLAFRMRECARAALNDSTTNGVDKRLDPGLYSP